MVDVATQPAPAPAPQQPAPRAARATPLLRIWWALGLAVAGGLVMLVAFPTYYQWWAAPIGVAMLAVAVHRRRFWPSFGLGTITGLFFLVPLLSWAGGQIGAVWLILPCAFSLYFGLMAALSAAASPVVDRWRWTWPLVTGSMWVLQEALRDRTPFGGFPWGRLAFSQADSPLLRLAVVGGAPLVTFGVAALGGLLAAAFVSVRKSGPAIRDAAGRGRAVGRFAVAPLAVALAPVIVALALVYTPLLIPAATSGTRGVTVAIVQGNVPRLGLEFNSQRRAVLDNHVNATLQLAADVKAGKVAKPDFVVWPENASDIDPEINQDARDRINEAADAIGVPILVGGLLEGPGPNQIRNVGIVWQPLEGPTTTYAKRHPVPFAEYIPLRSFARMITNKVDLVRTDFVAGTTPGVMPIDGTVVGDVICFEVAYDDVVRDTVTGGGQVIVVQTNNATFDEEEARQQLAMVQLRAVEHGRPALMASTVGISGFVDTSGRVSNSTGFNERAVVVQQVAVRSGRTMATELGALPELTLVLVAVGAVVAAVLIRRRRRTVA